MKTRPEADLFDPTRAGLVEVLVSDYSALEEYSLTLWRAAYEPHLFPSDVSETLWARSYSRPALEAGHGRGEKIFWVLMDGKRAGFVAYRLELPQCQMRLSKIYLHPDYWGLGLGSWVLESVTNVAINAGAKRIDLYVFRRNTRAIQAYLRAGFRIERKELTDLGGGVVYDDYVMVKETANQETD